MKLNEISDNKASRKPRKRVGRGIGSGRGGTSGRGTKGQKSRSGVSLLGFEGGQMPLFRRLPKRGFNNPFRRRYQLVNLATLQRAIDAGKLDAKKTITAEELKSAGVIRRARDGIRLLAKGELNTKVSIEVAGASKAAVAAVEKSGGQVSIVAPKAATGESKAGNGGGRRKAEESETAAQDGQSAE